MRLISDELEICSPVSTYLDKDARGIRRKVYEVEVSEDMAWRVRKSMQTFGERFWPGRIKIWEKPAEPVIPIAMMSKWDREYLRKLSHVRLFVYLDGKPPLLKPKWDGQTLEEPVMQDGDWFDYLGREIRTLEDG
jgi:hypothetical protein